MPKNSLILDENLALKRKKTAKITALCLMSVAFVLVVLIVVAACITTNLKPKFIGQPDRIVIYNQSSTYGEFSSDQQKYEDFMEKFDQSFTSSYLVALFSGRLGDYKIEDEKENMTLSTALSKINSGYYVEFKYIDDQTLTYANGDVYYSVFNKNQKITYNSIYFALSDQNDLATLDIYVAYKTNSTSSTYYVVRISQKANMYDIYENISSFKS